MFHYVSVPSGALVHNQSDNQCTIFWKNIHPQFVVNWRLDLDLSVSNSQFSSITIICNLTELISHTKNEAMKWFLWRNRRIHDYLSKSFCMKCFYVIISSKDLANVGSVQIAQQSQWISSITKRQKYNDIWYLPRRLKTRSSTNRSVIKKIWRKSYSNRCIKVGFEMEAKSVEVIK